MTSKNRTIKKFILWVTSIIVLFVVILIVNLIIVGQYESIISKGQPIGNYSDPDPALLVVDIQEATTGDVSAYPYFKEHSAKLINNINRVAERFSMLHLPVVYVRSEITNPLINLINSSYAKGSPGAQYDRRLKVVSDAEVVKNGKDSFRHTDLDSILIRNRVNELYIVGLDAAECVNATVDAARNRGYKVVLIEEAVLSKSQEAKDSMMVSFRSRGARVINIDSLSIMK